MNKRFFSLIGITLITLLFLGASAFLFGASPGTVQAAFTIHYVAPGAQCGINTPCYAQVQTAVDAANTGDEIRVAAGAYTGVITRDGNTQLVYVDKTITIRGGYDPVTWAPNPTLNATILDAQGLGRVLYISGAISPVIEGLQLTNGSASSGGGVYIVTATVTLQQNKIYSNTATYSGAGIYVINSPSIISNNQIYSNTTGSSGRGGGMTIANSPAEVRDNMITGNQAHVGGGIELKNSAESCGSGAFLHGNTIQNNTAFDYYRDEITFDGAGGGIDIGSYYTDTLKRNIIYQNTAKWGGGIHSFGAPPVISENTIQGNYAPIHGGGLYVQWGSPTIQHNDILSNTADAWGGGLKIHQTNNSIVSNNTFQGNIAGWRGGGVYASNAGDFDSNIFQSNTAVEQGGGMFSIWANQAIFSNNVWKDNHAAEGAGIYLWGSTSHFIHNTIVNNTSGDGRGIVIDKYPGLVNPSASEHTPANVSFTNTILTDHSVGIFATEGNTLTVNSILWHNTPTPIQATGVDLTVQNEFTGDPQFAADGYHLKYLYSAAADRGVAVDIDHDVDGQLRPIYLSYDLGADEMMITVDISPETGGTITYTDQQEPVTITITVPPEAITSPIELEFSPFPPPPPGLSDPFLQNLVTFGPPFRLTPFRGGLPVPTLTLSSPVTVTMTYQDTPDNFKEDMLDLFEILALLLDASDTYTYQSAACDSTQPDDLIRCAAKVGGRVDVPICDFGGVPSPIIPNTQIFQYQINSLAADGEFVYYLFMAERVEYKVYLPILLRQY